jgi:cobalt-zinc-cadmium efflux system protein
MHDHSHQTHEQGSTRNISIAFYLNFGFTIIEIIGGIMTNSLAILSDSLHDFGDCISLGASWYLEKISGRKRSGSFSYGYKRFSLLGAVINSLVIMTGSVVIFFNAVPRILNPEPVYVPGMIGLSIAGILINGIAVLKLTTGKKMHERVIMLHLLEDVLGWVVVLVSGIVMLFIEIRVLDSFLSIGITAYILFKVVLNMKKILGVILQSVPLNINPAEIEDKIRLIGNVKSVHDVHFWSLDGDYNISTIHVIVAGGTGNGEIIRIKQECRKLMSEHKIEHVTIEIEDESEECNLCDC